MLKGSRKIGSATPGETPSRLEPIARFAIVSLTGEARNLRGAGYLETTEGYFVREQDAAVARAPTPPADLIPGEKWIDVNLGAADAGRVRRRQAGVRDDRLERPSRRRGQGEGPSHAARRFSIREKHIAATMDDDSATDGPYSIEDVPWIDVLPTGAPRSTAFSGTRASGKSAATAA